MSSLTTPPPYGSAHSVPALARIEPKNNQDKTMHLFLSSALLPFFLLCHFSCLKWQKICNRKTTGGGNRAFYTNTCLVRQRLFLCLNRLCSTRTTQTMLTALSANFTSTKCFKRGRGELVVWGHFGPSLKHPSLLPREPWIYSSKPSHTFLHSSCGCQIRASPLFVFRCSLGVWIDWMSLEGIELVWCISPLWACILASSET